MPSPTPQPSSTALYDFLGWIETNKQLVLAGAAALVVVGLGVAVVARNTEAKAGQADEQLLKLRGSDSTDFLRIATDFSKTPAAERALLLAARADYEKADYAKAKSGYERFLQAHPNHPASDIAAFGLAASTEATGDQNGAITAYENLLTRYKQSGFDAQARLAIARIYEAQNKPEMALKAYDEMMQSISVMTLLAEVLSRKDRLLNDHPELATNVVSEITTNVVSGPAQPVAAPAPASPPATP